MCDSLTAVPDAENFDGHIKEGLRLWIYYDLINPLANALRGKRLIYCLAGLFEFYVHLTATKLNNWTWLKSYLKYVLFEYYTKIET